jgi:hypothetical protein
MKSRIERVLAAALLLAFVAGCAGIPGSSGTPDPAIYETSLSD